MRNRWGVLISGNGSTLQSLIDCRDLCDLSVVVSSTPKAYGLVRAKRAGVAVEILPSEFRAKEKRAIAEKWIIETLAKHKVQKVFLAGFMKIISADFIKEFEGHIFNIHPSYLPRHKGLDAFERALRGGDLTAGVTIHEVVPEVDSGELVLQREIEIPHHREENLSHLWLHMNEQRIMRDAVRRLRGVAVLAKAGLR